MGEQNIEKGDCKRNQKFEQNVPRILVRYTAPQLEHVWRSGGIAPWIINLDNS
jgi:hypothetical protein